jgi:hypothetical protein
LVNVHIGIGIRLVQLFGVLASSPRRMGQEGLERLCVVAQDVWRGWQKAKMRQPPKLHLLMHMAHRAAREGNPSFHSCFIDESLNSVLRDISVSAHRSVWETRVFQCFDHIEAGASAKRQKKG